MILENLKGFRLSPQQRRLWQAQRDGVYVAQCAFLVDGELGESALDEAFRGAIHRHEILRTAFRRQAGMRFPVQVIQQTGAPLWNRLSGVLETDGRELPLPTAASVERLLREQRDLPLDLESGSPLRLSLVPIAERRHLLLVLRPTLCADTESIRNLLVEVARLYGQAGSRGESVEEPLQYVDVSQWLEEILVEEEEHSQSARAYWTAFDLAAAADLKLPGEQEGRSGDPVTRTLR